MGKLEKFKGEYKAGKKPVEIKEDVGSDDVGLAAGIDIPRALVRAIDQTVAESLGPTPQLSSEDLDLLQEIHILATTLAEENGKQPKPNLEYAGQRLRDAHVSLCEGRGREARQIYERAKDLLLDHTMRPRRARREYGKKEQRAGDEDVVAEYVRIRAAWPAWSSAKVRAEVSRGLPNESDDRAKKRVLAALKRAGIIIKVSSRWVDAPAKK